MSLEGKEKRVEQQREKERQNAADAIAGQELLSQQIKELSDSIQQSEAENAERAEAQRKEKVCVLLLRHSFCHVFRITTYTRHFPCNFQAMLVAHAKKYKAEV